MSWITSHVFIMSNRYWSKTGHTFQGQSAGLGCTIPCIIVQPGNKQMEGIFPGLLYMFLS